jgi:hypothetical protein
VWLFDAYGLTTGWTRPIKQAAKLVRGGWIELSTVSLRYPETWCHPSVVCICCMINASVWPSILDAASSRISTRGFDRRALVRLSSCCFPMEKLVPPSWTDVSRGEVGSTFLVSRNFEVLIVELFLSFFPLSHRCKMTKQMNV